MKFHYCWFGNSPKSPLILKCIASWRRYCPNAEIIEWNESNFDINVSRYTKEAYLSKKWAFVSDYCRFYVLYNYGGVYLDTDVELLRNIDDLPTNFVGFENPNFVASGLIRGAQKGDWFCKLMLKDFNKDVFIISQGVFNEKTVCERETELLCKYGLKRNNKYQQIVDLSIFPSDFFCPIDYKTGDIKITKNTHSIHHYAASWCKEEMCYHKNIYKKLSRILPIKLALPLTVLIRNIKFNGYKNTTKKIIRHLIAKR